MRNSRAKKMREESHGPHFTLSLTLLGGRTFPCSLDHSELNFSVPVVPNILNKILMISPFRSIIHIANAVVTGQQETYHIAS